MTTDDPNQKHKQKEGVEPMETNEVVGAQLHSTGQHVPDFQHAVNNIEHPLAPKQNLHVNGQAGDVAMHEENEDETSDRYQPEATIRFKIDGFSEFIKGNESRLSQSVFVRGLPWKIMAMPRDNPRDKKRCLGFFLQCNAETESSGFSSWSCNAHAYLRLIAQKEGCSNHERKISHMFYPKENDWGYSQFQSVDQLTNAESGWFVNDSIILEVSVTADAPHGVQWDSKKHTGYIGLKNQGATCYMNSLLQTLFFTNKLRKAVYQLPTEKDDPQKSVALAMQRVFFDLQFSDKPVGTKKLTRSFGWDTFESFLQHDVQELCRVLLDNLESKMKGTSVEGIIPKLFEGRMKSYIRCANVDFESNREEPFYDIALNVKGKKNLYESFDDYIKVETLEGDNKYDAGDYGLQDAQKGITFIRLPPVLHLQLMRFQYDPYQDANVKINDRFEFPDKLDLTKYMDETLQHGNFKVEYTLHAVLVHSGDNHGGHYVVYVNPKGTGRWCKFDDDVVSRASKNEVLEASYGGDDPELPQRACTNAYMLVYIRDNDLADVLAQVMEKDIPVQLRERLEEEREQDAIKKKERTEAHLYQSVMVVGEEAMVGHAGFDLLDPETAEMTARKFRIKKTATHRELYALIADSYKLDPGNDFRLWLFSVRQNHKVFRPSEFAMCDSKDGKDLLVDDTLREEKSFLFMELPAEPTKIASKLQPFRSDVDVLVFLKFYDPKQKLLSYKGHMIICMRDIISMAATEMARRASLPRNSELKIYREVGPGHNKPCCEELHDYKNNEFSEAINTHDVEDGIILIYMLDNKDDVRYSCPTPEDYFVEILNRVHIEMFDKDEQVQPVTLRSSLSDTQATLLVQLGRELNYDAHKIQLFRQGYRDGPNSTPLAHEPEATVKDVLGLHNVHQLNQSSPVGSRNYLHYQKIPKHRLFFGKVPIRVDELAKKRQLKICWMDSKMKVEDLVVYPDRNGTIRSILDEVQKQVQLAEGGSGKLRLVNMGTTSGQRILNIVPNDEPLDKLFYPKQSIDPRVRVEEIPLDQINVDVKTEHLLPVAHFHKDASSTFGVPFLIKVKHGEKYTDVKNRIQKLLDISDKELEKYKFAVVTQMNRAKYVDDLENFTVNLSDLNVAPTPNIAGGRVSLPWLGLDHINKNKSRGGHPLEKAIVIHN